MRAVMVVVARSMPTTAAAAAAAAGHRDAALFADLRVLCFHAGGDFRPIRDDVGTQPHRIGRTSLLYTDRGRAGRALGTGLMKTAKKQRTDRQYQPANEENGPHLFFPGLEKSSGMKVAGEITAVDGLCGEHRISGG